MLQTHSRPRAHLPAPRRHALKTIIGSLFLVHRELTRVRDGDLLGRGARLGADRLDSLDHIHTVDDDAEHDVLAVEPRGLDGAEEELGAVGSRASVGHGKDTRAGVLELEVLIGELGAVNGLAAGARAVGEIAALDHEVGDNAVEGGALVVERLAGLSLALLASAECAEVLDGLRDGLAVESHDDAARGLAACATRTHRSARVAADQRESDPTWETSTRPGSSCAPLKQLLQTPS
eukprot:COSAG02_NODE_4971_length_4771_cov_1.547303_2_plen_235_part_00